MMRNTNLRPIFSDEKKTFAAISEQNKYKQALAETAHCIAYRTVFKGNLLHGPFA